MSEYTVVFASLGGTAAVFLPNIISASVLRLTECHSELILFPNSAEGEPVREHAGVTSTILGGPIHSNSAVSAETPRFRSVRDLSTQSLFPDDLRYCTRRRVQLVGNEWRISEPIPNFHAQCGVHGRPCLRESAARSGPRLWFHGHVDRQFFLLNTLMVGVDKLRKGTTKVPIDPKRPA